jgi:PPOX class probable F420-dependent enzyme
MAAVRLTTGECRVRLASAQRAVLASVTPTGAPHAVPITLAVDGDVVDHKPKRSTDLQRLRNIRADPRVALLVDHYDADWAALWWVRADGTAEVVDSGAEHDAAVRLLAARYPSYVHRPPTGPVVRVLVDRWTGWAAS